MTGRRTRHAQGTRSWRKLAREALAVASLLFLVLARPCLPVGAAPSATPSLAPPGSTPAPGVPEAPPPPGSPRPDPCPPPGRGSVPGPAGAPVASSTPPLLSLHDALGLAVETSPDVLQRLSEYRQARLQTAAQYVPLQPTLTSTSTYGRYIVPGQVVAFGANDQYVAGIALQQTIATFGRVRWQALATRLTEKQKALDYLDGIETVLQQVAARYLTAQLSRSLLDIARARVEYRTGFLETSRSLARAGLVARYDVLNFESNQSLALQGLEDARKQADLDRAALLTLLGIRPDEARSLDPPASLPPPPASVEEGMRLALQRRADLQALRWALESAQANVTAQALASAPSVALQSSYQAANQGQVFFQNSWNVGLQVNLSFYDGGAARVQRRLALEAVTQVRQQLERARRQVLLDVEGSFVSMTSYWKQIEVARLAVGQAREAMRIAGIRYRNAVSSSYELLQAEDALIQARQILATIETRYLLARVDWVRAISDGLPVPLPPAMRIEWEAPVEPMPRAPSPSVSPAPRRTPTEREDGPR